METLVVTRAYSDNYADVMDVSTGTSKTMSDKDIIKYMESGKDIFGVTVYGGKICKIQPYGIMMFATEEDAREHNLNCENKLTIVSYDPVVCAVYKITSPIVYVDVAYYVGCTSGDETTYIGMKGYTVYMQAARRFEKRESEKIAAIMTKKSKTGKHWYSIRVPLK